MELNDCINFLLTRANKMVSQYFTASLAKFDVTPVQYSVLHCLWQCDMQTPTQIASTLMLDTSTLTGLLDRMESKKLLMRVPDPEDRRVIKIALSVLGRSLQPQVEEAIANSSNTVLNTLDTSEQARFLENLRIIIGAAPYDK